MSAAASRKTPPAPPRYRDDPLTREVLRGVELMSPRPSTRHALCAGQLHLVLGLSFGRRRGPGGPSGMTGRWWLLPEPELHLEDEDPIVPDLAGWRMDRLPTFPHGSSVKLPPDWVCEILSPSTEQTDRTTKMDIYAAAGVPHVWLVDPIRQTLEVFKSSDQTSGRCLRQLAVFTGDQVARVVPFDKLELELSEIWPPRS